MERISKSFPGVQALDEVDFTLREREVHALVGENGAGKTTLMNILNGVHGPDSGRILLRGHEQEIDAPSRAQELGISVVHQELNLIPPLSVTENILIGHEPQVGFPSRVDWETAKREARKALDRINLDLDLDRAVEDLTVAQQQMVEIAKALFLDAEIVVMDEPTSSLAEEETERLFEIISDLRSRGQAIIYISHSLDEVFEVCDRVTVLRDGQYVDTQPLSTLSHEDIVGMMIGQDVEQRYIRKPTREENVLFEVENLSTTGKIREVSFHLREGEILGVAGLQGAGKTELLEALFGDRTWTDGVLHLRDRKVELPSPAGAIDHGITYLPEDRKRKGLFLNQSLQLNVSSASLSQEARLGFISFARQSASVRRYVDELNIATPSLSQLVLNLSGGNQQKCVLAKCLKSGTRIMLLNRPTRGIDVGAKVEVYRIINQLSEDGVGIVMASEELPELLETCDRVMVLHQGERNGMFPGDEATKERLMTAMTGGTPRAQT